MSSRAHQLARWFDEHGARLLLYARQCVRSGSVSAEDLVQDVVLRLLNEPVEPASVKAWLYKAIRNAAIDQQRSSRRRSQREQQAALHRGSWFEPRPEDLVDAATAEQALRHLPHLQREIVVLRIWGQFTLKEVADTVAMPLSSVHDQYKIALAAVRAGMSNRPYPAPPPATFSNRAESELL